LTIPRVAPAVSVCTQGADAILRGATLLDTTGYAVFLAVAGVPITATVPVPLLAIAILLASRPWSPVEVAALAPALLFHATASFAIALSARLHVTAFRSGAAVEDCLPPEPGDSHISPA
jgi:hypothetical protein